MLFRSVCEAGMFDKLARSFFDTEYDKTTNTPGMYVLEKMCSGAYLATDETRSILEAGDKIYTQIKIDEITNLGAVKIRIRSLFAAARQKTGVLHG